MGGKDLLNTPGFLPLVITLVAAPMAIIAILVFAPKQTAAQANTNKYAKINKAHRRFTNNFSPVGFIGGLWKCCQGYPCTISKKYVIEPSSITECL